MVSIYDIAKKVEVSATTVSRVLNGKYASTKTKVKVLKAVEELGYIPNGRASDLKTKGNTSIGVIIPDIANPIYPAAVKAIHDTAKARGYHLILGNTYGRADEEMEILRMMARERVAGLILAVAEGENDSVCNPYLQKMLASGIFLVLCGRDQNNLKVDKVTVDNIKGAYKATDYLLRTGRKRVAFIEGKQRLLAGKGRLSGYLQALSDKGISRNNRLISSGEWNRASGIKQMESILNAKEPPDAVFCGNDLLAIGAMESIENAGLRIPDDIAVVGFDDIEMATLVRPKLTTVVQPQEKIGILACSILLDRVESKETGEPKEILIEPELIVRESA